MYFVIKKPNFAFKSTDLNLTFVGLFTVSSDSLLHWCGTHNELGSGLVYYSYSKTCFGRPLPWTTTWHLRPFL